jgi:tRNA-2-methylthio-N6-dimethylallyladenosine synthase
MNELDSEKIAGSLLHDGMEPASDPGDADVIILNTCSIREKAVQKVYGRLGDLKRRKAAEPELLVGVVGCMAQLEGGKILERAPFVNIVAGPQKGHRMPELVAEAASAGRAIDLRMDDDPEPLETGHVMRESRWRAGVTISEGCNRLCAFCVVPQTRGPEKNRAAARIVREIEALAADGYVEVVLLGQTVNSYEDPETGLDFAGLVRRVAEISGLRRIRFTSPHPKDFTDALLEVMVEHPNVCDQIHLPAQSGSTRVLVSMRRGYTRERYLETIAKIRAARRPIAISTDIIVGFPGEREQDFADTLALLDAVQYDSVFSFKYSRRPNTAALGFSDEVPEEE